MITTVMCGIYIGEMLTFALSGYLASTIVVSAGTIEFGGWSSIFYFFGLIGILWFPVWMTLAYETPESHPYISREEKKVLRNSKFLNCIN
jgi:MFS family permease